jgi:hypothetical protein
MVDKKQTLITSPACTIVVDGVAYTTGETCPGAYPNFGEVSDVSKGDNETEGAGELPRREHDET